LSRPFVKRNLSSSLSSLDTARAAVRSEVTEFFSEKEGEKLQELRYATAPKWLNEHQYF